MLNNKLLMLGIIFSITLVLASTFTFAFGFRDITDFFTGNSRDTVSESNPQPSPSPDMNATNPVSEINPQPSPSPERTGRVSESNPQPSPSPNKTNLVSESNPQPSPSPTTTVKTELVKESNPQPSPSPYSGKSIPISSRKTLTQGTQEHFFWGFTGYSTELVDANTETLLAAIEVSESKNTFIGKLYSPAGLAALNYNVDFKDGKKSYSILIQFDADHANVYNQYNGVTTLGGIWALELIYDNSDETMSTLKLIKEFQTLYADKKISGFADMSMNFKSHNCTYQYIDETNPNYIEGTLGVDKQVIVQKCIIDLRENTNDYFHLIGFNSLWYESMNWGWD